jgi:hypothetical protein
VVSAVIRSEAASVVVSEAVNASSISPEGANSFELII